MTDQNTPPADDVREARFQALHEAVFPWSTEESTEACNLIRGLLDEIRQRGAVTDAAARDVQDAAIRLLMTSDDVREALRDIIRGGSYSRFPGDLPYADVVDRILSDPRFEVRPNGTVTDTEVERAAREYHELGNGVGSFDRMADHYRVSLLFRIRAALEAAREARNAAHQ